MDFFMESGYCFVMKEKGKRQFAAKKYQYLSEQRNLR